MRALSLCPLMIASMSCSTALCVKCSRWNSWHTAFLFCLHKGSQLLAGLLSPPFVTSRPPSPVTSVSRWSSLHHAAFPGLVAVSLSCVRWLSPALGFPGPFLTLARAGGHLSGILRPVSEVSCPREAQVMQEGRLSRVSHFQTGSSGRHQNMIE